MTIADSVGRARSNVRVMSAHAVRACIASQSGVAIWKHTWHNCTVLLALAPASINHRDIHKTIGLKRSKV
jgi:hypothetical protein